MTENDLIASVESLGFTDVWVISREARVGVMASHEGQQWRQVVTLRENAEREHAFPALRSFAEFKARDVGLLPTVEEEIAAEWRAAGISEDEITAFFRDIP